MEVRVFPCQPIEGKYCMKITELFMNKNIVLVCGNIASGKGHFIKSQYPTYEAISVSSCVKELSGFKTRSQLGTTKDLDNVIANLLIERIMNTQNDNVIVDGVRQITILNKLQRYFKDQIKDIIWLHVPEETLRQRFEARNSGKDDMSFDKAMQSDRDLGIGDVENYIKTNHKVVPY